jgi:hypothetical protein
MKRIVLVWKITFDIYPDEKEILANTHLCFMFDTIGVTMCDSMLLWINYFSILSGGARADVLMWLRSWLIDTCILPLFAFVSWSLSLFDESNKRTRERSIRVGNIMLSDLLCSSFFSSSSLYDDNNILTDYDDKLLA